VFSGDLVRRDAEGFHYFEARRDRLLKVAGHRLSPTKWRRRCRDSRHRRGRGFGQDGGAQGHRIVLCVTRRHRRSRAAGTHPSPVPQPPAALHGAQAVHVLPALPHNANGKVDFMELQRRLGGCTGDR